MKHTGAKTKTDAVNQAVADYNAGSDWPDWLRGWNFHRYDNRGELRKMRETD